MPASACLILLGVAIARLICAVYEHNRVGLASYSWLRVVTLIVHLQLALLVKDLQDLFRHPRVTLLHGELKRVSLFRHQVEQLLECYVLIDSILYHDVEEIFNVALLYRLYLELGVFGCLISRLLVADLTEL